MGNQPIPPPPRLTNLDAAKRDYILGRIDVYELEERIGLLLAAGTADDVGRIAPPPLKPADATYRER